MLAEGGRVWAQQRPGINGHGHRWALTMPPVRIRLITSADGTSNSSQRYDQGPGTYWRAPLGRSERLATRVKRPEKSDRADSRTPDQIETSSDGTILLMSGNSRSGGNQAGGVQHARRVRSRSLQRLRMAAVRERISSGVGSRTIRRSLFVFLTIDLNLHRAKEWKEATADRGSQSVPFESASSLCPVV